MRSGTLKYREIFNILFLRVHSLAPFCSPHYLLLPYISYPLAIVRLYSIPTSFSSFSSLTPFFTSFSSFSSFTSFTSFFSIPSVLDELAGILPRHNQIKVIAMCEGVFQDKRAQHLYDNVENDDNGEDGVNGDNGVEGDVNEKNVDARQDLFQEGDYNENNIDNCGNNVSYKKNNSIFTDYLVVKSINENKNDANDVNIDGNNTNNDNDINSSNVHNSSNNNNNQNSSNNSRSSPKNLKVSKMNKSWRSDENLDEKGIQERNARIPISPQSFSPNSSSKTTTPSRFIGLGSLEFNPFPLLMKSKVSNEELHDKPTDNTPTKKDRAIKADQTAKSEVLDGKNISHLENLDNRKFFGNHDDIEMNKNHEKQGKQANQRNKSDPPHYYVRDINASVDQDLITKFRIVFLGVLRNHYMKQVQAGRLPR